MLCYEYIGVGDSVPGVKSRYEALLRLRLLWSGGDCGALLDAAGGSAHAMASIDACDFVEETQLIRNCVGACLMKVARAVLKVTRPPTPAAASMAAAAVSMAVVGMAAGSTVAAVVALNMAAVAAVAVSMAAAVAACTAGVIKAGAAVAVAVVVAVAAAVAVTRSKVAAARSELLSHNAAPEIRRFCFQDSDHV
ncbi:unnamed protein product [Ectocarpus sp. CCAP 1310/34]|nr:unnamed protein product [Ectocarpus sp. CCAP 1310/34]